MSRARAIIVGALFCFAGQGCLVLTDLDGLASGGAPASDAAPVTPPSKDGGAERDADEIDADGGSQPAAPFCARQTGAVFCDDFQRDQPKGSWLAASVEGAGSTLTVVRDEEDFLRAAIQAGPGPRTASLFRLFDRAPTTTVRYDFSLRAPRLPTATVQTMRVAFGSSTESRAFVIELGPAGVGMFEQRFGPSPLFRSYTPSEPIVLSGAWARLSLRLTVDATDPRIELTANGRVVIATPSKIGVPSAPFDIIAGLAYSNPVPDATLEIDDIAVFVD